MEKQNSLREIRAAEVTLEVTDSQTGLTLRRTLPIDYLETANCLRLAAEDAQGRRLNSCSIQTRALAAFGTSPAEARTRTPAAVTAAANNLPLFTSFTT